MLLARTFTAAKEMQPDVIVLEAEHNFSPAFFSGTTERVMQRVQVPLIVVPPGL
jgi:hypothetical protein